MLAIKWLKKKEAWSQNQRCARCKITFKEINNIGRWECAFHPGTKEINQDHYVRSSVGVFQTNSYYWSCCGRTWTANHERGCRACDHSMNKLVYEEGESIGDIHVGWLDELQPRKEAVSAGEEDLVFIKRLV